MKIPNGFKELQNGEAIQASDVVQWSQDNLQYDYCRHHVGKILGEDGFRRDTTTKWRILRKIDSPWISIKERLPESTDWYFVSFRSIKGGFAWWDSVGKTWTDVSGLRRITRTEEIKEWMEIPERLPEPIFPPITIQEGGSTREHELIFNKDGSIKAGCAIIDKEKMEEIIERWKKEQE